jgi:hypothetical protein
MIKEILKTKKNIKKRKGFLRKAQSLDISFQTYAKKSIV